MCRYMFSKWLFFSKIHTVINSDIQERQALASKTEQKMIEREMRIQDITKAIKDFTKIENEKRDLELALISCKIDLANSRKAKEAGDILMIDQSS
jgi:thioredoxin-like negative regulator of GroEL